MGFCAALSTTGATDLTQTNKALSARLAEMSIEQLVDVEVVSVNSLFKKQTSLDKAPAAVAIVTADDIRRLGITTLPEALRMVPGLNVARIDSHQWAVSARGFNAQFANKLLILVDGRTIYGPAYGGVNWGMQDILLEDLDRIEVIRGPGAALWGANAVNGVINILTKSARDTQGVLVSSSIGTEDQPSVAFRYGGQLATNLYYRVYGKYFNRDGLPTSTGAEANDSWTSTQGGVRLDWEPTDADKFTLQGNLYDDVVHDNENIVVLMPPYVSNTNTANHDVGANVLGRWTHEISGLSSLSLQAYFDHFRQEQVGSMETRDTFDFDAQHRFPLGERHDIIWGLGYHYTADKFPSSFFLTWTPLERQTELFSAFVQDEITLVPERLSVTIGSKFEHNDYTGVEIQPSLRLLWTPTEKQTVWAAVSRAVRTPSRYETGARVNYSVSENNSTPGETRYDVVSLFGNSGVGSENLIAFELGYRFEPMKGLSFDIATFYNQYNELLRFVPEPSFDQGPITVFPQTFQNAGSAETYGVEISSQWKVTDQWRLMAGYSFLNVALHPNDPDFQGNPQHQFQLRSYLELPWNLELDGAAYFVDQQVAASGLGTATVPAYLRLDLGLIWHPTKSLEIGIWGHNLLDDRHPEFPSLKSSVQTEIPRGVSAKITWKF
ncbi:MAG: TonB-dependent receptor [Akkermansiaceae bacterium]|nr:TonB-dependent receptor [Verrucomicrobiales bacterium]